MPVSCQKPQRTGGKFGLALCVMKTAIQKIMVPLDPSDYAKAATIRACLVAKSHDASLTGTTVLDSPGIRAHMAPVDPYIPVVIEDSIREFVDHAKEQIATMRKEFASTCDEHKVEHTEPKMEGVPASQIIEASALHDLVVIGLRTFFHFETSLKPGDSLASILRRTVTPILAVPAENPEKPFSRALIAYDGSMNASRTLREFVAFAAPYDFAITVIIADPDERQSLWHLEEATSYLRAHGIENFETQHFNDKKIPDHILDEYDLIAAGIHSGRFFKDRLVGSLTNKLIERGDKTLFLSH